MLKREALVHHPGILEAFLQILDGLLGSPELLVIPVDAAEVCHSAFQFLGNGFHILVARDYPSSPGCVPAGVLLDHQRWAGAPPRH